MITVNGRFQCDGCDRLIGKADGKALTFTEYGGEDEPEPSHYCGKCVEKWSLEDHQYARTQVWIPAHPIFPEGGSAMITVNEMIRCVDRELSMRRRVYPRRVESGKMRQDQADKELSTMEGIKGILESLRDDKPLNLKREPEQEELFG